MTDSSNFDRDNRILYLSKRKTLNAEELAFLWEDRGLYWHFLAPQRTTQWFGVKAGRIGGSSAGTACGLSNFDTPDELKLYMAKLKVKEFTPVQRTAMDIGTASEDYIVSLYENRTDHKIKEYGYCAWKEDDRFGVSVDGVVYKDGVEIDGIIEIKTATRMYRPLISFTENGGEPDDEYSHIWKTHYCQMQLGMKILNKNWCDYIVYCPTTGQLFIQRVPFNETFWSDTMFPKITAFLDETDVLLKEQGIRRIPVPET